MSTLSRDHKAFEILVRDHHRRLLAYALSLVKRPDAAEDLVQEAFLVAYRKLAQFDPARDFGAWMRGIVRLKWLESCRRREIPIDETALAVLEEGHRQLQRAQEDGVDSLAELRHCLAHLDQGLRDTIDRFYFEGMPSASVAEQLGIADAVVRKRLQRAREALSECLHRRLSIGGRI